MLTVSDLTPDTVNIVLRVFFMCSSFVFGPNDAFIDLIDRTCHLFCVSAPISIPDSIHASCISRRALSKIRFWPLQSLSTQPRTDRLKNRVGLPTN